MSETKTIGIHYIGPINDDFSDSLLSHMLNFTNAGVDKIVFYLSSGGGSLHAAYAAYNYLRSARFQVDVVNTGTVESAAVYLYLAGQNRYYLPGSRFMIHPPSWTFKSAEANYPTIRDALLYLEQWRKDCNRIFCERTAAATQPLDIERYTTNQNITLTGSAIEASAIGTILLPPERMYPLAGEHYRLLLSPPPGEIVPGV